MVRKEEAGIRDITKACGGIHAMLQQAQDKSLATIRERGHGDSKSRQPFEIESIVRNRVNRSKSRQPFEIEATGRNRVNR